MKEGGELKADLSDRGEALGEAKPPPQVAYQKCASL
jgi:hypothetical protein